MRQPCHLKISKAANLILLLLCCEIGLSQNKAQGDYRLEDTTYLKAIKAEGVQMVAIRDKKFKVWTKKEGSGKLKLLLLHGGPGTSPEYFENFSKYLGKDYTIYLYSQLGTYFSDIPKDSTLYSVNSFVEDIEEVRKALQLEHFYLLGHSWGSYLAQAYASSYQTHVKGLILCNNINEKNEIVEDYSVWLYANILDTLPEYKMYADSLRYGFTGKFTDFSHQQALGNQIREKAWPIMINTHYVRLPNPLPEALMRSRTHSTGSLMSDLGFQEKINATDYNGYLANITAPTLLLGSKYDFIPPWYYTKMRDRMTNNKNVDVYICPLGSHFAMWDDAAHFFAAVNSFILKTENTED